MSLVPTPVLALAQRAFTQRFMEDTTMFKYVILILVLALALSVSADGMIMPEEVTQDYVGVRYHHVTVTIDGIHAVTEVEQEFYNPYLLPVTGRYLFPVAPDMLVTDFQVTLGGVQQSAVRQDAATTNRILYDMVAQRRDPSLLQYIDWETLALDINLPAHGSHIMMLRYEEVLTPDNESFHYRYIMSTERYSVQPLESASITVRIRDSEVTNLYSPTYPIVIRSGNGVIEARWTGQNVNPSQDFDLFFTTANDGFGGMFLTGTHQDQPYFLFLFSPEMDAEPGSALPKDIVFVIDRSGSMGGEKILQAQGALRQILGQLNSNDRFSIVGFDDVISVFSANLQPVNEDSITEAYGFVDELTARNSTDIGAALQTGLEIMTRSETRASATEMIVFLTDGLPTAGLIDDASIMQLVEQHNREHTVRIHAFGVGYDVNTHLLDRLAAENGGVVTYVQPGENLETVLGRFYAQIANPVLTDIHITFDGVEAADLFPQAIPDMFQGSSLVLAGRYQPSADRVAVRVQGNAGDVEREYVYQFDLGETGDHDFVSRLWATRRIGYLLDVVRVEGETEAVRSEIQILGFNHGIVTPYTTFIISPQTDGAASSANMSLYSRQDELNQVSGSTTVQARVQNQVYQNANQVYLAQGANIANIGRHNLVQVGDQYVELGLIAQQQNAQEGVTPEWIAENIHADQVIEFGSEAYMALASDPEARPLLQSGTNVLFSYHGQVILVQDGHQEPSTSSR
jgi:Ca-activated chloride channel family protein